ncbi:ABC transporter substrate-binding protein [Cohnella hashimotonis]|uniref:ABC transporter substrate-binding protein n=1 Tax=Cohnella hashimotonis TaxID=2826895 RepID=A0ABT6TJF5_9BACL|nr:ABC transporter substrate-binding protein [Cohnella hashimotonis]MDI4646971.1 ABC transporter substrate-binding protein [Cohnella hashimotonis]
MARVRGPRRRAAWSAFFLAIPLVLAGCGGQPQQAKTEAGAGQGKLVVTDFAGREVALGGVPQRIVTLGNGETDIVYALGGQVAGRPDSEVPLPYEGAEQAARIGTAHEVDLERIALLHPDVVLGNDPMNVKDIPTLEGIGAKMVLTSANSIEEIERQIALIGQLLERSSRADELIAGIEEKRTALASEAEAGRPRALLVYGAPGTFMAALPTSLGGNLLEAAGGYNIASDYPRLQSYPQYAQLNAERIVDSDPEVIFIMTHGNPEEVADSFVAEMRKNEAWNNVAAVRAGRVEVLPAELFGTNPGTRVVEALELLRHKLYAYAAELSDENTAGQGGAS